MRWKIKCIVISQTRFLLTHLHFYKKSPGGPLLFILSFLNSNILNKIKRVNTVSIFCFNLFIIYDSKLFNEFIFYQLTNNNITV